MSQWGYVVAGWGATAIALGGYSAWVLLRGRALAKRVPPDERRWM